MEDLDYPTWRQQLLELAARAGLSHLEDEVGSSSTSPEPAYHAPSAPGNSSVGASFALNSNGSGSSRLGELSSVSSVWPTPAAAAETPDVDDGGRMEVALSIENATAGATSTVDNTGAPAAIDAASQSLTTATSSLDPQVKMEPASSPEASATPQGAPLPSLLRYVDNTLVGGSHVWNRPKNPAAICLLCNKQHDQGRSYFLPLSPCGCWMHWDCFMCYVADDAVGKTCCPLCNEELFVWEGIVALTLAERTAVKMKDVHMSNTKYYVDASTGQTVTSDYTAYLSDTTRITAIVTNRFMDRFRHDAPDSPYKDGSPDLLEVYYQSFNQLLEEKRPASRWLQFDKSGSGLDRSVGYLLFGAFAMIKLRSYLMEHQAKIRETEGWVAFENGREMLQKRIQDHVRGDGWSWTKK